MSRASDTGRFLELLRTRHEDARKVFGAFSADLDARIADVGARLRAALAAGHRVFAFGNGGSASDAQHFAAELVGRYKKERGPLPAMALTANTSTLTAIGNDYGYATVFERQVRGWVQKGDLVLAISTSGNSENVLLAAKAARELGATLVALTGESGGKLAPLADVALKAPATETARIQEAHIHMLHLLCELVDLD